MPMNDIGFFMFLSVCVICWTALEIAKLFA